MKVELRVDNGRKCLTVKHVRGYQLVLRPIYEFSAQLDFFRSEILKVKNFLT